MIVDARGKPCPKPVVMTKDAIATSKDSDITILVDNDISKENVIRFLKSNHLTPTTIQHDNYFEIKTNIESISTIQEGTENQNSKIKKGLVYCITSESMGHGDCELGQLLMKNMLFTIDKLDFYPETMIFINTGVYLTTLNNDAIAYLKTLSDSGVKILSCGTCINFFKLNRELKVGEITDTYTVLKILNEANKIINL